jgi:glutathione synthase/RimK-type ligase-like ATP-grasp enzyme
MLGDSGIFLYTIINLFAETTPYFIISVNVESVAQYTPMIENAIANTRCLKEAARRLNIPVTTHDDNGNFISLELDKPYYFANATTPFNGGVEAKICKDKEFAYKLLKNSVKMPRTIGFVNPDCEEQYKKYLKFFSHDEIVDEILKQFKLPVIVKMNAGSLGANVFKCQSREEILRALEAIFNINSSTFDYVALAQEYIDIKEEFRVVIYNREVVLAYKKDISEAAFTGNLSPLHHENAKAIIINDQKLIDRFSKLIQLVFSKLDIMFAGLDIIIDTKGEMYLLELNAQPGFNHLVQDNGDEPLIAMYTKILLDLSQQSANVYYYGNDLRRQSRPRYNPGGTQTENFKTQD